MSDHEGKEIIERLHKMTMCIHIAVEEAVANDIASGLREAIDEIKRLQRHLALAEKSIECFESDRVEREAEIERLEAALSTCRELREYDRAEIERLKIERAEFETLMAARLKAATKRMENMRAILLEKRQ